jgi:hypothetical protein
MSLTKLSLAGNYFPARKSLVIDISSEDGKTANLFYSVVLSSGGDYIKKSWCGGEEGCL